PTHSLYRRRARYKALIGDTRGAEADRREAERVPPADAADYFLRGYDRYLSGDLNPAARDFGRALELQPDHFWAGYFTAVCALKSDRPSEAKAALTACLAVRKDFGWAYLLRALASGDVGNFDAAEADFREAEKRLPDRYGVHVNRGIVRTRAGR